MKQQFSTGRKRSWILNLKNKPSANDVLIIGYNELSIENAVDYDDRFSFLCRLRSIAAHRDHFVRHLSVCLSVRPSVTLSW